MISIYNRYFMANQYVTDYIKSAREQGKTDAEIRTVLSTHPGVTEADIAEGLTGQASTPPPVAPVTAVPSAYPAGTPGDKPGFVGNVPLTTSEVVSNSPRKRGGIGRVVLTVFVVLILLAVAGVAYAQYSGLYSLSWLPVSSEKLWAKFQGQTVDQAVHTNFSFSYADSGSESAESPFGGVLKDVKASVSGSAYTNGGRTTDALESQSNITYSLASGNTSFSTGLEFRVVGKALYLNVGQNPFLSTFMMGMNSSMDEQDTKHYDWIKISLDPKFLEELGSDEGVGDAEIKTIIDQRYWQDLANQWKKQDFLEKPKYVGSETVRGVATLHYQTNIKKDVVRAAVTDVLTKVMASSNAETKKAAETFVSGMIDKLQVQSVDIWVGKRDAAVYKVTVQSNAPSVASYVKAVEDESKAEMDAYNKACSDYTKPCNPPASLSMDERVKQLLAALKFTATFNLNFEFYDYGKAQGVEAPKDFLDADKELQSARGSSRDAKRLSDVRQLASALELYFNDNNKYPSQLSDLLAAGQYNYIGALPTPPTELDGSCTVEQNKYAYTLTSPTEYRLTFCLGAKTGGYSAGVRVLSPSGIQ